MAKTEPEDIEITREQTESRGRYAAIVDGHESELTYSRMSDTGVIADHTYVPDVLRGRGVGAQLVNRLISDARAEGFRIVPLCPYVKAQFARHPEWSDLVMGR